jgi:hypothetical protein
MKKISKNQLFGGFFSIGVMFSTGALADTLYKCAGPGGSVAYTNKQSSFTACKAIGSYALKPAAARSKQAERKVDYSERPDVRATSTGVVSSAAMLPSAPLPKVLRGAVYKVERSSGITEYTNVRPRDGRFALLFTYISTCVACDLHSTINFARTALNVDAYKAEVDLAASEFGVDAALLRAVIHAESAFNPMAISAKGAQGLMQLMPGTATDLGVEDAFDAAQNIRGGAEYLARMLKDFDGDERLAAAAYNAGPGAVRKYANVPPYAETQVYVERVATLRDRYRKAL